MTSTRVALVAAVALLLTRPVPASGQVVSISGDIPTLETKEMPKGTGLILGRTVDPGTNQPVAGAFVSIYTAAGSLGTVTDSAGRFVFRDLPKGKFTLRAMKSGYGYGVYGKHLPDTGLDVSNDSAPLELIDDEHRGDIVIKLWKYAAIGGVVRDDRGEPVVGISVRALAATYAGGRRVYSLEDFSGGSNAITDDRGMFRLSSLIPGEYVVVVPIVTQSIPRSLSRMLASPGARPPQMLSDSAYGNSDWASSGGGFGTRETMEGTDAQFTLTLGPRSPWVAGQTREGRVLLYEMQFYPGVSSLPLATPIALRSGEERSGIDFALKPIPTVRISGRVTGPNGPLADLAVGLARADIDAMTSDPYVAQAITDADGTFRFLGVAPGEYIASVLVTPRPVPPPAAPATVVSSGSGSIISSGSIGRALPTEPMLWAAQRLTVGDGDIENVALVVQRGGRITGRVEFQGSRPKPAQFTSFYVERADGTQSKNLNLLLGVIDRDGNFSSYGQPPGKYFIRVPYATADWYFAGARLDDRDISITPIEVTGADVEGVVLLFRDTPGAEIAGVVRSDGNKVDYAASVVAFPVNRATWGAIGRNPPNFRTVGVLAGGRYTVADLPAGEYFVAALPESRRDWCATATLEALSRTAVRVTVGDREKKTQDLTLPRRAGGIEDESVVVDGHGPWVTDDQAPARDQRPAAPRGSGVITGIVVAVVGGDPIRRARVTLSGAELLGSRIAITDDAGRFTFENIPAGRFTVAAEKATYLIARYGSTGPGRPGTPITLAEAQRVSNITLALARGGVITGALRDERGEPLSNAVMQLMQYRMVNGVRRLSTASSQSPFNLTSDDRGRYRFFGVDPGEYLVAASIRGGQLSGRETTAADVQFAEDVLRRGRAAASQTSSAKPQTPPRTMVLVPFYYPGTSDAGQARLVSVAAGQEAEGIDFVVSPVAAATIRGVVNPSSADIEVRLVSAAPNVGGIQFAAAFPTRPGPGGEFMFTGVAPGHHTVVATTSAAGARGGTTSPRLWALAELDVAGVDIPGVTLSMQPAMSVSGSIAFDGTTLTAPAFSGIRVSLAPDLSTTQVSVSASQITVNADGTFAATGVMPGRYTLRALLPTGNTGWIVRSAMLNGKDVSDTGFDVPPGENVTGLVLTHTDRPSEISGTLQDASGRPAPDYFIIVFPTDKSLWRAGARRILSTRPGTDGKFTVRSLLAGSYHLAAVTDAAPGEWFDPAFLERLVPAAFTFQLAEGEKKVQDVQIRK